MKNEVGEFSSHDQLTLFRQNWLPEGEPIARVIIVHGLGEHSDRFGNLVEPLTDSGIAVHSYDLRGHGRSGGPRGHIDRWQDFRHDLLGFLGMVEASSGEEPIFLYGHSLGSLIVLEALTHTEVELEGAIVSGVALNPDGVGTPVQKILAKLLSNIVPRLSMDTDLDTQLLSSDPSIVEAYERDPLVHSRATVRFATESLAAIERINSTLERIKLPILLLHGEKDHLTTVEGARRVIEEVGSADTELRLYPGVMHEPHNDIDHRMVSRDVVNWLIARID